MLGLLGDVSEEIIFRQGVHSCTTTLKHTKLVIYPKAFILLKRYEQSIVGKYLIFTFVRENRIHRILYGDMQQRKATVIIHAIH